MPTRMTADAGMTIDYEMLPQQHYHPMHWIRSITTWHKRHTR